MQRECQKSNVRKLGQVSTTYKNVQQFFVCAELSMQKVPLSMIIALTDLWLCALYLSFSFDGLRRSQKQSEKMQTPEFLLKREINDHSAFPPGGIRLTKTTENAFKKQLAEDKARKWRLH